MNTENLKTTTYRYNELCDVLEEPQHRGGNQKKKQLEQMKRYFDFEIVGKKYVVTEIYDEPKAEIVKLRNNKTTLLLNKILLDYFNQDQQFETFKSQLLLDCGLCTVKLKSYKQQHYNLDDASTSFVFSELNKILDRSLKSLKKHGFIELERKLVKLDKYNTPLTPEEQQTYQLLEQVALKQLSQLYTCQFLKLNEVRQHRKLDKYYSLLNGLCEMMLGCTVATKLFIVQLNPNKRFNFADIDADEEKNKLELNKIVNDLLATKFKKSEYLFENFNYTITRMLMFNEKQYQENSTDYEKPTLTLEALRDMLMQNIVSYFEYDLLKQYYNLTDKKEQEQQQPTEITQENLYDYLDTGTIA